MMFCGDGSLQSISLDDEGQVIARERSERIIDVDGDPVFEHSTMIAGDIFLLSYKGMVHQIDVDGVAPSLVKSFSLLAEGEEGDAGWLATY
ncbi:MAG: amine dehydrogenase large subunit [Deinococcales bacterium]